MDGKNLAPAIEAAIHDFKTVTLRGTNRLIVVSDFAISANDAIECNSLLKTYTASSNNHLILLGLGNTANTLDYKITQINDISELAEVFCNEFIGSIQKIRQRLP